MKIGNRVAVATIACILLTTIVVSCIKTHTHNQPFVVTQQTPDSYASSFHAGGYQYGYASQLNNGRTISKLKISGKNSNLQLEYILDTTEQHFRLIQHRKVQTLAEQIASAISLQELREMVEGLSAMIEHMFKDMRITKQEGESIFFHQAALRTRLRALERNDPDYACIPYPAYLLGRSYFFCQEDVVMKRNMLLSIFEEHQDLFTTERNRRIYEMVQQSAAEEISFDKVYAYSMSGQDLLRTMERIVNGGVVHQLTDAKKEAARDCAWWCPLGCGTDWGCCGNYSGCCFYASLECYIHDRLCSNCEPRWFCFEGCVPDKK